MLYLCIGKRNQHNNIMNELFDAYKNSMNLLKSVQDQVLDVINEIVKKLQGKKGYVKFNENTSFPCFEDDTVGMDAIIAARWNEKKKKLQFITDSQCVDPEDISPESEEWFYWKSYGKFDFDEFITALENIAK